VAWFGDDLRAGNCTVRPKVEVAAKTTLPLWSVNGVDRAAAPVISPVDGKPVYGGTPADFSVVQAIQAIKARGLRVTFYPFPMMDVPPGNTLPNPWSNNAAGVGQAALPWRGRITCSPAAGFAGSVDKTGTAATQVAAFFGTATPGRRAGTGSGLFMHFSGALELHDGIGRAESVGNFLQYRQILCPSHASATEPARAPAGRTARCGARRGSSPRGRAGWGDEWDRDRIS